MGLVQKYRSTIVEARFSRDQHRTFQAEIEKDATFFAAAFFDLPDPHLAHSDSGFALFSAPKEPGCVQCMQTWDCGKQQLQEIYSGVERTCLWHDYFLFFLSETKQSQVMFLRNFNSGKVATANSTDKYKWSTDYVSTPLYFSCSWGQLGDTDAS